MSTNVQQSLVNKDFQRAVKTLRRVLPKISFGLLIGTYLISAVVMVIPHVQANEVILMIVGSVLIHLAIQAGRGTLVFFFQLNPARYQSRFSLAIIAATLLLALSMWNAVTVFEPYGWAWTIPVNTLMLIGYIIEVMILRETLFATNLELYQNKDQWQELKDFYIDKTLFEKFMDDIKEGKYNEYQTPFSPVNPKNNETIPQLSSASKAEEKQHETFGLPSDLYEELKILGVEGIRGILADKKHTSGSDEGNEKKEAHLNGIH